MMTLQCFYTPIVTTPYTTTSSQLGYYLSANFLATFANGINQILSTISVSSPFCHLMPLFTADRSTN